MELSELLEIAQKELSQRKSVQVRCCTAAGCLSSDSQAIAAYSAILILKRFCAISAIPEFIKNCKTL